MSAASDRSDQPEDPSSFAPKWARGPAHTEGHQQPSPYAAVPERGAQSDDHPATGRSPAHRSLGLASTRTSQPGPQATRRRGEDEVLERAPRIDDDPATDVHRRGRSLE